MNSTATWESEELERVPERDENLESTSSPSKIATVKDLALRLLYELQCVAEVTGVTIGNGLDFYDEVSRFEIDLIERALLQTGGHQVQAARLLNLKVTTLNSKIKHYNISTGGFTNVYALVETQTVEDRTHA